MSKTKWKMAEALKKLAKTKSLKKITIQDIVEESGMTRQSFYYHFHDIYEIIEWICKNDIMKNCLVDAQKPEEWIYQMFQNMSNERKFYKKVILELGRDAVEKTLELEVHERIGLMFQRLNLEENSLVPFLSVSLTNYLVLTANAWKEEERIGQIEEMEESVDFLVVAIKNQDQIKML